MIKVKDGYGKLIGTTYQGSANHLLRSNGDTWEVHTGKNNEANKIVRTDGSGYLQTGWISTTSGDMGTTSINRVYCSNDSYIRYKTPANFFSSLTNNGDNLSITIASQNRTLTVQYAKIANQLRSKGTIAPQTGRTQNLGDVYSYHLNASVSGGPTTYAAVIGFGRGTSGSVEIAGEWTNGRGLWVRALRDTTDNWYAWDKVLTQATYTGITDSRYYTKTQADERYVNVTGDTMTGPLIVRASITGTQLISNIADGTAPLKVTSKTVVTNLNSDLLDGYHIASIPLKSDLFGDGISVLSGFTNKTGGSLYVADKYIGLSGYDGQPSVILVAPIKDAGTTKENWSGCIGRFTFERGSTTAGLNQGYADVSLAKAYHTTSGNVLSNLNCKVGYCVYNSQMYLAIYFFTGYSYFGISFSGRYSGNCVFNRVPYSSVTGWTNLGIPLKHNGVILATIDSNVYSATKLQTARTIWGQSFDGTGNITGPFSYAQVRINNNNEINSTTDSSGLWLGYRDTKKVVIGNNNACFLEVKGKAVANQFVRSGSSDAHVLLGGGGHKAISDFATSGHTHSYLPLSGGTVSGNTYINRNSFVTTEGAGTSKLPEAIISIQQGTPLYNDPTFALGTNSCSMYNNAGGGTVTVTRISDSQSSANGSGYILQIKTTGAASPGIGGFVQTIYSRANAIFAQVIYAKIPVGRNIHNAENSMGTGSGYTWLTSRAGTGKWAWYVRLTYCGNTGTFSTGGHVYLDGAAATSAAPVTWYVAYCQVFDITKGTVNLTKDNFKTWVTPSAIGAAASSHTHSYLPLTGGTVTGITNFTNRIRIVGTAATPAWNSVGITFTENTTDAQAVSFIYTSYDTYRAPAGIKLIGNQGNEWFEAPKIYATTFYGALSGNASSATKLQTARTINGTSFDGTVNITTAKWGTARTITLSGAVTGSATIDGSGNVSMATTYQAGNIGNLDARYVNVTGDTMTGYLTINTNGAYVKFGCQNGSHAHYETSATVSHYFNKTIDVNGVIRVYNTGTYMNATGFYRNGSSNSYTLLGGGGHKAISQFIYSDYGSCGVNERTGNSDDLGRAGFWRDNNLGSYGVTLMHSDSANYQCKIYHDYGNGGNLYMKTRSNGTWGTAYTIWNSGNLNPGNYVTALGTNGNYLTWTKNGTTNNITVPYATYASYLPTAYIGGAQYNPQTYFNQSMGVKVAMTAAWSMWSDTLWINGYAGGDVLQCVAIHTLRNGQPRMALSAQASNATAYGAKYEVWTSYNFDPNNLYWANIKVSTSSSTGTSPTFSTAYTSNWFRSTGNSGWYSETYGGGWHMTDTTYIRAYGSKRIYTANAEQYAFYTAGGMTAAKGFWHSAVNSNAYVLLAGGSYKGLGDFAKGNAGASNRGVYVAGGTVTAMTYYLNATVNSGTSGKLAYYSGANTLSSYTSTVGRPNCPIYFNEGVPTTIASTYVNYSVSDKYSISITQFGRVVVLSGWIDIWYWPTGSSILSFDTSIPYPLTDVGGEMTKYGADSNRGAVVYIPSRTRTLKVFTSNISDRSIGRKFINLCWMGEIY